jgi:hypothetical protein
MQRMSAQLLAERAPQDGRVWLGAGGGHRRGPSGTVRRCGVSPDNAFIAADERKRTLEIHRRLKPGAPFVVMHLSFDHSTQPARDNWLSRYAEFAISSGVDAEKARTDAATIGAQLPVLRPRRTKR